MNKAHLTAISRKGASEPCKALLRAGAVRGRVLDYGCGRGADVRALRHEGCEVEGFDPYYAPAMPEGTFDTVLCTYVLNVLPDEAERTAVLEAIRAALTPGGRAYVTVRRDVHGDGYTTRGTWQGRVDLDLPVLYERSGFATYMLEA